MSWFVADDNLAEHPKVLRLLARPDGLAALGFWVLCGTWSRRLRTSGHVPRTSADAHGRKAGRPDASELASALVEAELWDATDDGWQFVDWDDVYRDDAKAAEKREKEAERKRQQRARKKAQTSADSADASGGRPADVPRDPGPSPSPSPLLSDPPVVPQTVDPDGVRADTLLPPPFAEPVVVPSPPANDQARGRGVPTTHAHMDLFGELLRAEAFAAEPPWSPAPKLSANHLRTAVARAAEYAGTSGLTFEAASRVLLRTAIKEARDTENDIGFVLARCEAGKPRSARRRPQVDGTLPPAPASAFAEAHAKGLRELEADGVDLGSLWYGEDEHGRPLGPDGKPKAAKVIHE